MISVRPRRSALYVPASNVRAIEKARGLECDVVILDLEDAVAPDCKAMARKQAADAVRLGGFSCAEVVVRVNSIGTPWGHEDINSLLSLKLDAILVPKVNAAVDIERYHRLLRTATPSMQLWAMIETARSVLRLEEIAAASRHSRLSCFVLGINDLARETAAVVTVTREAFFGAMGLAVAAARAYGLGILDGVYNSYKDDVGLIRQCRQGVEFGFEGKTLVHPQQIESCNAVFSPQPEALRWARAIIEAFDLPANADRGAITLDGQMVERLHLAQARRAVDLQLAIDARFPIHPSHIPQPSQ